MFVMHNPVGKKTILELEMRRKRNIINIIVHSFSQCGVALRKIVTIN